MSEYLEKGEKCKLPCGTEGSMEYKIIDIVNDKPALKIKFEGALRDYEDDGAIKKWWKEITLEIKDKCGEISGYLTVYNSTTDYHYTLEI